MSALVLRPARSADAKLLWQWANDSDVRRASFSPEPIAWEAHEAWLEAKLATSRTRIWLLEHDCEPVGQVRYDSDGAVAEIDYSVAAPSRGRGFGAVLLHRSAPLACGELSVGVLVGLVRDDNHASCRAFERAGFRATGREVRQGAACVRYTWRCPRGER